MKKAIITKLRVISAVVSALLLGLSYAPVYAASLTSVQDEVTRLKNSSGASVYANHTISFSLGTSTVLNPSETIVIDFDDGFALTGFATSEAEDYDIKVAGADETIVAAGGCASNDAIEITTVNNTDKSFTFTACGSYTAAAAGSAIEVQIGTNATTGSPGNDQIINPTTSGTKIVSITAAGDTGSLAIAIIDEDQIPVTASVNPTITLTVVNTALALGILDSGLIRTSGYNNIQIGTNGAGGYTITVRGTGSGTGDGLYNTFANKLIASSTTTLATGAEGYGAQCNDVSSDGACDFATAGENVSEVGLTGSIFAHLSGAKPSGTEQYQIRVKAAISTSTDAGGYNDTLTVMGTANF